MSQVTMYPGIRGSPTTTLSAGIDADDLQIVVESTAGIPELPNLLVLGESETDPNAETVVAASRDGTTITLSARGENAVAWGAGTIVWRPFCVEDLAAIQTNIGDHESRIQDLEGTGIAPQAWYTGPIFSRASDSSFTVGDTTANAAIFLPGRPIRYRETSGTWRYGIVTAYSSGTVTLAGRPMTTSDDDELQYADMSRVVQMPVIIPGYYEDASDTTLIANDLGSQLVWGQGAAYLVRVRARSRIHDSGTHGTVNVSIAGSNVLSSALSIDADATWYSSTTGVSASYYDVQFDEVIEIAATKAGNGDAQDLTVLLTFVVA